MGIRKLVVLVVAAGSLALTSSASANPILIGLPVPPVLPVVQSVVALTGVNPLSPVCPQVPGTNYYDCAVTPVPGTTLDCVSGYVVYPPFAGNSRTGCAITSPGLAIFCGDSAYSAYHGGGSQEGCFGVVGTTVVALGCTRTSDLFSGDTLVCAAGPVSYRETMDTHFGAPPTQTLAIGNIKYACVNDVCQLVTS